MCVFDKNAIIKLIKRIRIQGNCQGFKVNMPLSILTSRGSANKENDVGCNYH